MSAEGYPGSPEKAAAAVATPGAASGSEEQSTSSEAPSSNPWQRIRQLLQRVSELEADVQSLVQQKCFLEKQNEELTARVEVWVNCHTDGVVLEREAFIELERSRQDYVDEAAAKQEIQGCLEVSLSANEELKKQVAALTEKQEATEKQLEEAQHSVSELQAVISQLMLKLSALDVERGELLEEKKRLSQAVDSEAEEAQQRESEAKEQRERDAAAGAEEAKQRETEAIAEERERSLVAEAFEIREREVASQVEDVSQLREECVELRTKLRAEEVTFEAEHKNRGEALRIAEDTASLCEELRWKQNSETQQSITQLQDELASSLEELAAWRAECQNSCAEMTEAREEHRLAIGRAADLERSMPEAASMAETRIANKLSELEATSVAQERVLRSEMSHLSESSRSWDAERSEMIAQLENQRRDADLQKKAIQTTLGQLVMEKQELQLRLDMLSSK